LDIYEHVYSLIVQTIVSSTIDIFILVRQAAALLHRMPISMLNFGPESNQ